MKYYIDTDLKTSRIYIAPFSQSDDSPYLIECEHMGQAESLLRKLNFGSEKSPLEEPKRYILLERISIEKLGELDIFSYRT